jgi:proteasome lid subunit RPN8/RPN11
VERWPRGAQNQILVPPHANGLRNGLPVVATFHTHPNPGPDFQQEPSLTDIRAVRDDKNLSHTEYEGEYVIARDQVYCVRKNGSVEIVGLWTTVLGLD